MPRGKKKNPVSVVADSFISSINKTGGSTSWITAVIFIAGGLFSFYMGYIDVSPLLLLGGPFAILIGLMVAYKAWYSKPSRKRRHNDR